MALQIPIKVDVSGDDLSTIIQQLENAGGIGTELSGVLELIKDQVSDLNALKASLNDVLKGINVSFDINTRPLVELKKALEDAKVSAKELGDVTLNVLNPPTPPPVPTHTPPPAPIAPPVGYGTSNMRKTPLPKATYGGDNEKEIEDAHEEALKQKKQIEDLQATAKERERSKLEDEWAAAQAAHKRQGILDDKELAAAVDDDPAFKAFQEKINSAAGDLKEAAEALKSAADKDKDKPVNPALPSPPADGAPEITGVQDKPADAPQWTPPPPPADMEAWKSIRNFLIGGSVVMAAWNKTMQAVEQAGQVERETMRMRASGGESGEIGRGRGIGARLGYTFEDTAPVMSDLIRQQGGLDETNADLLRIALTNKRAFGLSAGDVSPLMGMRAQAGVEFGDAQNQQLTKMMEFSDIGRGRMGELIRALSGLTEEIAKAGGKNPFDKASGWMAWAKMMADNMGEGMAFRGQGQNAADLARGARDIFTANASPAATARFLGVTNYGSGRSDNAYLLDERKDRLESKDFGYIEMLKLQKEKPLDLTMAMMMPELEAMVTRLPNGNPALNGNQAMSRLSTIFPAATDDPAILEAFTNIAKKFQGSDNPVGDLRAYMKDAIANQLPELVDLQTKLNPKSEAETLISKIEEKQVALEAAMLTLGDILKNTVMDIQIAFANFATVAIPFLKKKFDEFVKALETTLKDEGFMKALEEIKNINFQAFKDLAGVIYDALPTMKALAEAINAAFVKPFLFWADPKSTPDKKIGAAASGATDMLSPGATFDAMRQKFSEKDLQSWFETFSAPFKALVERLGPLPPSRDKNTPQMKQLPDAPLPDFVPSGKSLNLRDIGRPGDPVRPGDAGSLNMSNGFTMNFYGGDQTKLSKVGAAVRSVIDTRMKPMISEAAAQAGFYSELRPA